MFIIITNKIIGVVTISHPPAHVHEELESGGAVCGHRQVDAVAADAPDDGGRVNVVVGNLLHHQLPHHHSVRPVGVAV